ncbi:MAG: hypothetical protein JST54_01955 [Deltaproteobacteria bacterium]|nr:hypothetical protein [Deltaproteobacteria bacterium]
MRLTRFTLMDPAVLAEFTRLHELSKARELSAEEQTRWTELKAKLVADQERSAAPNPNRRPISKPG